MLVAVLAALASQATGARVLGNSATNDDLFVLEGYDGSAWSVIASDQYHVRANGLVLQRALDDSGAAVDWTGYAAWRWSGFIRRIDGVGEITNEPCAFVETNLESVTTDSTLQMVAADAVTASELQTAVLRADENGLETDYVQVADVLRLGKGVQTKRPRAVVNDDSFGDDAWTNVTAARREDGEYASVAVINPGVPATDSNYLRSTNFNFRIPRGATITNVTLYVKGYASTGSGHVVYPQLVYNGAVIGDVGLGGFDDMDSWQTFAGDDAVWGASLSSDMVNDDSFGVALYAENQAMASTIDFYVDAIRLEIVYRTARGYTALDAGENHFANVGNVNFVASTATPTDPTESSDANVYVKDGKLVVQYNDAGTVRYKYLDLTGTGATWADDTTAP